jgi:hypothetical protein
LSRRQIRERFDEIVEFADLADAIDRQVKFYSTGMHMRLGFAVAAFLDPDILLVDEALAVGDSAFQQRCLEKMNSVLENGCTLVFVSHDLASLEGVCRQGVWLHDGVVTGQGSMDEVIAAYRHAVEDLSRIEPVEDGGPVALVFMEARGADGATTARSSEPWIVSPTLVSDSTRVVSVHLGFSLGTADPTFVITRDLQLGAVQNTVTCVVSDLPLARGNYAIWLAVSDPDGHQLLRWRPTANFDVVGPDLDPAPYGVARAAPIVLRSRWETHSG